MLLALIIKLFQKMWPKLGRRQSWRVSMHAPFGNFAWAPHHCRGARGGYESLLHPRVTWRFFHLLASGCAFPVLLNSSWYIITNVPFLLLVNTKNTPLEGGCGKQTSEWDHQRLRAAVPCLLCGKGLLHTAFRPRNGAAGSSWLRGAGLSREVKTCNSYCDKEHFELFLQSKSFLCPLYSLWLLDHNPLHLVPRIQLNAIYCHMFE